MPQALLDFYLLFYARLSTYIDVTNYTHDSFLSCLVFAVIGFGLSAILYVG